jgi:hypothetical protein
MDIEDKKSHIDFYKHLSSLSLVTFGGCVTLMGIFKSHLWLLLLACYLALAATFQSLYTIKAIVSENRIPYTKPGPLTRKLSLYAPYKFLMASLFIIAIIVAQAALETGSKEIETSEPNKSSNTDAASNAGS